MNSVIYAWDLGGALGHVTRYLTIADRMKQDGIDITFAATNLQQVMPLLNRNGYIGIQAPICEPKLVNRVSYTVLGSILILNGFNDPVQLSSLVKQWRQLLQQQSSTLLIADHAPIAILAARTLGVPVVLAGHGFFKPPLDVSGNSDISSSEATITASINKVLTEYECPTIDTFTDLYNVEGPGMLTCRDLDHYGDVRADGLYWGTPCYPSIPAIAANWPNVSGPKAFVYFDRVNQDALSVIHQLEVLAIPSIVHNPSLSNDRVVELNKNTTMLVTNTPVDLAQMQKEATIAITFGGAGLQSAFLHTGKPVLLFPQQPEQRMASKRVVDMGAGIALDGRITKTDISASIGPSIERLISDKSYTDAAKAFAIRNAQYTHEHAIENIANVIRSLC